MCSTIHIFRQRGKETDEGRQEPIEKIFLP